MITEFLVKLVALIFNVSHLLLECVLWLYLLLSRHKWFYRLGHLLQNRNPSKSGKCAIKSTTSVFTTSNICGVLHFRTDSRIMSSWRNRYCKITKRGVVRVLDSLPFHENHKIKVHRAVVCSLCMLRHTIYKPAQNRECYCVFPLGLKFLRRFQTHTSPMKCYHFKVTFLEIALWDARNNLGFCLLIRFRWHLVGNFSSSGSIVQRVTHTSTGILLNYDV